MTHLSAGVVPVFFPGWRFVFRHAVSRFNLLRPADDILGQICTVSAVGEQIFKPEQLAAALFVPVDSREVAPLVCSANCDVSDLLRKRIKQRTHCGENSLLEREHASRKARLASARISKILHLDF